MISVQCPVVGLCLGPAYCAGQGNLVYLSHADQGANSRLTLQVSECKVWKKKSYRSCSFPAAPVYTCQCSGSVSQLSPC